MTDDSDRAPGRDSVDVDEGAEVVANEAAHGGLVSDPFGRSLFSRNQTARHHAELSELRGRLEHAPRVVVGGRCEAWQRNGDVDRSQVGLAAANRDRGRHRAVDGQTVVGVLFRQLQSRRVGLSHARYCNRFEQRDAAQDARVEVEHRLFELLNVLARPAYLNDRRDELDLLGVDLEASVGDFERDVDHRGRQLDVELTEALDPDLGRSVDPANFDAFVEPDRTPLDVRDVDLQFAVGELAGQAQEPTDPEPDRDELFARALELDFAVLGQVFAELEAVR